MFGNDNSCLSPIGVRPLAAESGHEKKAQTIGPSLFPTWHE
jgi:hypothetical protein